jgi:hypothetical protein
MCSFEYRRGFTVRGRAGQTIQDSGSVDIDLQAPDAPEPRLPLLVIEMRHALIQESQDDPR